MYSELASTNDVEYFITCLIFALSASVVTLWDVLIGYDDAKLTQLFVTNQ